MNNSSNALVNCKCPRTFPFTNEIEYKIFLSIGADWATAAFPLLQKVRMAGSQQG